MPTFHYKALAPDGKKRKGFIEADTKAQAFSMLQDKELLPLSLDAAKAGSTRSYSKALRSILPFSGIQLGESCYYLALMLQSGTSLAEGLDLLGRMSGGNAGRIWMDIRDTVEGGVPFSKAMERYPSVFPRVYVGMVQVAESVGKLGVVLERIAEYEEQRLEVSGKLTTAMVYPAAIVLVGIGAVYFLLTSVLPDVAKIFSSMQSELPGHTKFLLNVGQTLNDLGPLVFIPPLVLIFALTSAYRRNKAFRLAIDKRLWQFSLPQKSALARFSGLLGFQLEAGIPLVQAMEHSANAISNSYFQKLIVDAAKEVSGGRPLDKVLAKTGAFPDLYVMTLATGQQSGRLGPFLVRLTNIFERELSNVTKRILAFVEPALILMVGAAVAFIILSVMEPVIEMTSLIR